MQVHRKMRREHCVLGALCSGLVTVRYLVLHRTLLPIPSTVHHLILLNLCYHNLLRLPPQNYITPPDRRLNFFAVSHRSTQRDRISLPAETDTPELSDRQKNETRAQTAYNRVYIIAIVHLDVYLETLGLEEDGA
jgi:hypothetical protein